MSPQKKPGAFGKADSLIDEVFLRELEKSVEKGLLQRHSPPSSPFRGDSLKAALRDRLSKFVSRYDREGLSLEVRDDPSVSAVAIKVGIRILGATPTFKNREYSAMQMVSQDYLTAYTESFEQALCDTFERLFAEAVVHPYVLHTFFDVLRAKNARLVIGPKAAIIERDSKGKPFYPDQHGRRVRPLQRYESHYLDVLTSYSRMAKNSERPLRMRIPYFKLFKVPEEIEDVFYVRLKEVLFDSPAGIDFI